MHVDPQHDCSELVPHASRASASRPRAPLDNVHLSTTCTSRQRAPLGHVHLLTTLPGPHSDSTLLSTSASSTRAPLSTSSATCASPSSQHTSQTPHSDSTRPHSDVPRSLLSDFTLRAFQQLSPSTLRALSLHVLTRTCPALFWARCIRVRQSGGHATPPPCISSLRKQADEDDAHLLR